jgi:hypothetical protein
MDLPTILSSGVLAGLVAGLVTIRTSERKIAIENITQQRQLWREKIRDIAQRVNSSYQLNEQKELIALYVEIQLLLNPEDINDNSILDTLWEMISSEEKDHLNFILSEKLSLLLKHDWERAKKEAKPIWYLFSTTERIAYKDFKLKRTKS